ncbi:MAG: alanine/glycine:cation symporter family protein [Thiopseudomonas sp.]
MDTLVNLLNTINGVVWGPPMLILILGVGLFLSVGLKMMPILRIGTGFRLMLKGAKARKGEENAGEIPPFQALMTALSATVGTGNIAGVATAIFLGGPGALFWMWMSALVGMGTKFSEAVLAVRFREVDEQGNHTGGPMYYIKNGLGPRWAWLGSVFALFGCVAAFGAGNTVQANSIADVLQADFNVPAWLTGLILMVLVGLVLIGGVRRIGRVAAALVPAMIIFYLVAGVGALLLNAAAVPGAIIMVVESAFTPVAAQGGFAGAAVWAAIRFGVARGIFSNEAGLGTAPIAHASAQTKEPVRQGLIAMLGTFIDTIIICSITGLTIVISGVWTSGISGAALTSAAFTSSIPVLGEYVVPIALAIFAFTTVLGWSYYGERCAEFLFGIRVIRLYRAIWVMVLPVGAVVSLELVWLMADTLNALMALPNLIALVLLSPVVFRLAREYFARQKEGAVPKLTVETRE